MTVVLDAAQLAGLEVPPGAAPQRFCVTVGNRRLTGQFNAKSLRKAVATIAEHGPENVAVILQGKLEAGDVLAEAGIMAQVKQPRPA